MSHSHENDPFDNQRANAPTEFDLFPPTEVAPDAGSSSDTPGHANRRKFISLLAVSAVGVATIATVGGITFAKDIDGWIRHGSDGSIADMDGDDGGNDNDSDGDGKKGKGTHHRPGKTPTPSQSPTPSPKQSPTPQPTTAPKPTPQPTTAPTGTVIGHTNQATNTAVLFTDPASGKASYLVHMSNGNWAAVNAQCTHAGVQVNYNAGSGQFNCPAHGAIFNGDGTNPQSPANTPLPPVHITVNTAAGTISTP